MPATKQQIRRIIADNNLTSAADVYSLLRESFKVKKHEKPRKIACNASLQPKVA